jgi:plasmid maintenance system antidote protein VapI
LSSSAALLDARSTEALNRTTEMATITERAAQGLMSGISTASAEVDQILVLSHGKVETQLGLLRESLGKLSGQSADEEARISRVLGEIAAHVETSASRISEIDRAATDQTAKLAFAVSALGESTKDVGSALTDNQEITQQLIIQSDRLLASLGTANREIDEVLPTAMLQLSERIKQGISQLGQATSSAESLDELSDNMLVKLTSLEHLIEVQRSTVDKLMRESDEHFASRHEQTEALASALIKTRSLVEEMTEDANTKLVSSMQQVHETTRQAAESSRKILDDELANVAEKLTDQNKAALAEAIDVQINAMNGVVKEAIERNVALSESAASRVAAQLGQLQEMTTNLEQRIADSKDGFEAIGDESFARRMVLLTESLNSTSIDVAKILSNDVTDTAWAAYLRAGPFDCSMLVRRAQLRPIMVKTANSANM